MKGGEKGGKATLTPHTQSSSFSSSGVLTDVLEAGIHRSIIKIHTADSQRIQVGIVMPHHLNTHTHPVTITQQHRQLRTRHVVSDSHQTRCEVMVPTHPPLITSLCSLRRFISQQPVWTRKKMLNDFVAVDNHHLGL